MEVTYVRLSKRAVSSSRRYCTSSTMSSSVHFRVERFLTKGRSCATSIAGRLADGAFATRFCSSLTMLHVKADWEGSKNQSLTRKVAITTRMTFSFTAALAISARRGIMSNFLRNELLTFHIILSKKAAHLLICSEMSVSNVNSQKQNPIW